MTQTLEQRREGVRRRLAEVSRSGRDCAPIPPIADVRRRTRCRKSLRLFMETYNPAPLYFGWAPYQLDGVRKVEEAITRGGLQAVAWPRGGGKTVLCRMAALWGVSYALVRYGFLLGANEGMAKATLEAVKTFMRFLPLYRADFPEICHPVEKIEGIAQRAGGQLCDGKPTMIEWGQTCIVLPTVPCPPNWPRSWAKRSDGMAPTSGAVLSASGLTGNGIRGSVHTLTTGEQVRPDFVLLDDPQTPESAASPDQNDKRERLVSADVLGMAGPGRTIAALMPCTVIYPDDMCDRLLDRRKHPEWRGERVKMVLRPPDNLDAWDRYNEVYRRCLGREPPDLSKANAYYEAHRAELDAGCELSWPERKHPGDVSPVQHAMHIYLRDRRTFQSEYQNDPDPLVPPSPGELHAAEIICRLNHQVWGVVPAWAERLTCFVDVQQDLLYGAVCAWGEGFTGAVLDYGAYPDQRRAYYALADARPTLAQATGIGSLEGSLWAGLTALCQQLLGRDWRTPAGTVFRVERCLIDSGWGQSTALVKKFCLESDHAAVLLPSKGVGLGASHNAMSDWPKKPGERRGSDWVVRVEPGHGRLLLYDAHAWKSFLAARLRQPLGEPGALTLYGADPEAHRLLADHCCAEYPVRTSGRGRELDEWKVRPGNDNHFWDCLVGCCVAASERGAVLRGMEPVQRVRRKVDYSKLRGRGT